MVARLTECDLAGGERGRCLFRPPDDAPGAMTYLLLALFLYAVALIAWSVCFRRAMQRPDSRQTVARSPMSPTRPEQISAELKEEIRNMIAKQAREQFEALEHKVLASPPLKRAAAGPSQRAAMKEPSDKRRGALRQ